MISNFIGGGQVFIHKLRMFSQVFHRTASVAVLIGFFLSAAYYYKDLSRLDWDGFLSYRKAVMAEFMHSSIMDFRESIGNYNEYDTLINVKSRGEVWEDVPVYRVVNNPMLQRADSAATKLLKHILILGSSISVISFIIIFFFWSRSGRNLQAKETEDGSAVVLTSKQVRKALLRINKCSQIMINSMPLVKGSETRHLLITGSTGSGKTNLMHNVLPKVQSQNHPGIVIDQTGEMIARYYNKERGDIIFNPFDERATDWDFWEDCKSEEELEIFSKILFGFSRKKSGNNADPFWEQSAEIVFNSCVEFLKGKDQLSLDLLSEMLFSTSLEDLSVILAGTEGARYLAEDNKTSSSILSVLSTHAKPIKYLKNSNEYNKFSLKQYFADVKKGHGGWLFLSTKPSARELTLPLVSCLTELAFTKLIEIGIDKERQLWFVIDELPSLGRLPALSTIMSEGRKYGACVMAAMQSLNQLYERYGHHAGSTIFGQFGTSFFFKNTEPSIANMISSMCGTETITQRRKNTSFGANEYRDGVSYNEFSVKKNVVEANDLSNLNIGECYVLLPEPSVRLSKMQLSEVKTKSLHEGFVQSTRTYKVNVFLKDLFSQSKSKKRKSRHSTKNSNNLNVRM